MPILFGKNRFRASQGLKKPVEEDNPEKWYLAVEPSRQYITDYGITYEFNAGHPLVDMYLESHNK